MIYDVKQDSFASTLIGSIKGAYEFYHKQELHPVWLFGLSGHAFIVNITKGIGPCAPYYWDKRGLSNLCNKNLGLELFYDEKHITVKSDESKKKNITKHIKEVLDQGLILLMASLEYQLIIGYENSRFIVTMPWGNAPSETKYIEFDTLEGLTEFMTVSTIKPSKNGDLKEGIIRSIKYAISLYDNPPETEDYAMGIKAYDFWLEGMNKDNCNGHGLWWSSIVWSENKKHASEFVEVIKEHIGGDAILDDISERYEISSELFLELSNKEKYSLKQKRKLVTELKVNEENIYKLLKQLPLNQ
jgi:hypothetical protein